MPDYLPRPIQDLIGRMLIINPQERIRIESIKEHPAFKMFLPASYTIPTPLPIPSITEVMDPSTLNPDVLKTLIEIGFADESELMSEFTREGHSMAKVFYSMLTTNLTLESLPWNSDVEEHPKEAFIQSPQNNFQFGTSPDILPESNPIGSEVFSLAEKAQWAYLPQNEYKYEVIQPCLGIQIPLEQLMMNLQFMLTSLHFQWFHPNDFTILSRRAEDMMYLVARVQRENEFLNMNLYFSQASQVAISNILEAVRNMLTPSE
ncbi:Serine/threonine-protein kinase brsk1 [Tritrichomonas musculus]|uniref:Serine/threonine-protein kinase brsk1 n=1 Tax=Tritrichomonas musculus TaxID=1915356 RepID=A0ABR2H8Q5_9EUKA